VYIACYKKVEEAEEVKEIKEAKGSFNKDINIKDTNNEIRDQLITLSSNKLLNPLIT
jgi:hypothetical protein